MIGLESTGHVNIASVSLLWHLFVWDVLSSKWTHATEAETLWNLPSCHQCWMLLWHTDYPNITADSVHCSSPTQFTTLRKRQSLMALAYSALLLHHSPLWEWFLCLSPSNPSGSIIFSLDFSIKFLWENVESCTGALNTLSGEMLTLPRTSEILIRSRIFGKCLANYLSFSEVGAT